MADETTEETMSYIKIEDLQQGIPNANCVNIFSDEGTVKRSTLGNVVEALSVKKSDYTADKKSLQDQIDAITDGTTTVPNAASAQSAVTAGKAENDEDGNKIKNTYVKKTAASQTITGDVNIAGNLSVEGESYETHLEEVFTKNDLIKTRDGAVAGLATGEVTGIEAEKYDGTNNGQLVFDKDGTARVGDVGDLQALATRAEESNMETGSFVAWDGNDKKLVTPQTQPITGNNLTDGLFTAWNANAKKLVTPNTQPAVFPAGMIIPWAGTSSTPPAGWLLCDGKEYGQIGYPELYAVIGKTYGGNTGTFKVPNLVGKFIEGAASDDCGETIDAGLPNIEGYIETYVYNGGKYTAQPYGGYSGPFGIMSGTVEYTDIGNPYKSTRTKGLTFNASKASSIYGKSDTVQPPAITMQYLIKY